MSNGKTFGHFLIGDPDAFWFTFRVKQLIDQEGMDFIAVEVQEPPNYSTKGVTIRSDASGMKRKRQARLGYEGGPALPQDVILHELAIQSMGTIRRHPELSNRHITLPDVSLEWLGKYEVGEWMFGFDPPLSSGQEELLILGAAGEKFDTPEKVDALRRYRYQMAVGNHLLFRYTLPWEALDKLAELAGYSRRRPPSLLGDQATLPG